MINLFGLNKKFPSIYALYETHELRQFFSHSTVKVKKKQFNLIKPSS